MKTAKLQWHDDNDGDMVFYEATIYLDDLATRTPITSAADCVELDISDRDGDEVIVDDDEYEELCEEAIEAYMKPAPI